LPRVGSRVFSRVGQSGRVRSCRALCIRSCQSTLASRPKLAALSKCTLTLPSACCTSHVTSGRSCPSSSSYVRLALAYADVIAAAAAAAPPPRVVRRPLPMNGVRNAQARTSTGSRTTRPLASARRSSSPTLFAYVSFLFLLFIAPNWPFSSCSMDMLRRWLCWLVGACRRTIRSRLEVSPLF
jgi:hypothetical protein